MIGISLLPMVGCEETRYSFICLEKMLGSCIINVEELPDSLPCLVLSCLDCVVNSKMGFVFAVNE